jgi:hypothetical protein
MVELPSKHLERLKTMVYHADMSQDTMFKMDTLRQHYIDLAVQITEYVPECRSKSNCLTHLEESLMRCIQALAMQGEPQVTLT